MTEQVVYSELEAYAVRWPYSQLEPIDAVITDNTQKNVNQSTNTVTLYSLGGTTSQDQIYGLNRVGMYIPVSGLGKWVDIIPTLRKVGSPPNLVLEIWEAKSSSDVFYTSGQLVIDQNSHNTGIDIYGSTWIAQTFTPTSNGKIEQIGFYMKRTGTPNSLVIEVRDTDASGNPGSTILSQDTYPYSSVGTTAGWYYFTLASPPLVQANKTYAIIAYQQNNGGNNSNDYNFKYSTSDTYTGGYKYLSTDGGTTWNQGAAEDLRFRVYQQLEKTVYKPGKFIHSEKINQTTVGTTFSAVTVTLSKPLAIDNDVIIILYCENNGGDTSNYYEWRRGTNDGDLDAHRLTSTDGGNTWIGLTEDMKINIKGENLTSLYSGTYTYYKSGGYSSGYAEVEAYGSTDTVNVYLIIDHEISNPVSVTGTTPTVLTIDGDPKLDKTGELRWVIAANGSGAVNYGKYRPKIAYMKNPVYPRDFGFSEMYLIQVKAEQTNTVVRLNDKNNIYLANVGDIFQVGEQFKTPVKKIQVLTGQATVDMLGVI